MEITATDGTITRVHYVESGTNYKVGSPVSAGDVIGIVQPQTNPKVPTHVHFENITKYPNGDVKDKLDPTELLFEK
jgi:hypothetical protein